jgi:hypothetical protein
MMSDDLAFTPAAELAALGDAHLLRAAALFTAAWLWADRRPSVSGL